MLSRAAERIYWAGRYLERAENAARLVQQYSHLLLDLPAEVGVDWTELVRIIGAAEAYESSGNADTETAILLFLLSDPSVQCSLAYSLRMARENMRNSRDLLPQESWEYVNELYQYAQQGLTLAAMGHNRFDTLAEIVGRCQQVNGSLRGTMSHHSPFQFLVLGQSVERADMTSRLIDVAAAYIQHNERLVRRYGSSLWTNVLKSVSGFQMYRQYCQPQVEGHRVIDFLLRDTAFPRAIACCLAEAKTSSIRLPRHPLAVAAIDNAAAELKSIPADQLTAKDVSVLMDQVQRHLGKVHHAVATTWFLPGTLE